MAGLLYNCSLGYFRGISAEEGNKDGLTPIILACQAGRHLNVDLLLKKARGKITLSLNMCTFHFLIVTLLCHFGNLSML